MVRTWLAKEDLHAKRKGRKRGGEEQGGVELNKYAEMTATQ